MAIYASPDYGTSTEGKRWDDGTFTSVEKITMTANDKTLLSVQLHYGLAGCAVRGKSFGGIVHGGIVHGGVKTEYELQPHERLTKMTGYKGVFLDTYRNAWYGIKSLAFTTDQGRIFSSGPYYGEVSDYFETTENGVIVGLFGSASDFLLNSIGVYMQLTDGQGQLTDGKAKLKM